MRLIGGITKRMARRSRWLAERLWLIAGLEAAWVANRHWRRLEPDERSRLRQLAVKSKGRPSNLSARERDEARMLLEKVDYAELGGNVSAIFLPFRPLARVVEFALNRVAR
jgi:hypothetical protein